MGPKFACRSVAVEVEVVVGVLVVVVGGRCQILRVLKCVGNWAILHCDWMCEIVFADAQDKELLAQCNITHILSIHDTAAPVLGVSAPLLTSVTFTSCPCL